MPIESFIAVSNEAQSVQDLFTHYQRAMASLGFDRLVFSLMTNHPMLQLPAGHGIMSNYPQAWIDFYMQEGYEFIDPVRHKVFTAEAVFSWRDIGRQQSLTSKQAACLRLAEDAGLHDGIGIPLRGPCGALAGIGAACSSPGSQLSQKDLSRALLLSQQFYASFRRIERKPASEFRLIALSRAEATVLEWCARGKTKNEIACILMISPHTVDFHLRKAQQKLEASNRIAAASKAIQQGLIRAS